MKKKVFKVFLNFIHLKCKKDGNYSMVKLANEVTLKQGSVC